MANFGNRTFEGKADCKGWVFHCFANFLKWTFKGEVDFSGAVFKDGASFEKAKFITNGQDVSFEGAVFESSENNVTFEEAQFGLSYERFFGDWEICFSKGIKNYEIARRKIEESPDKKAPDFGVKEKFGNLTYILRKWGISEFSEDICNSFKKFHSSPNNIFFEGSCFGSESNENLLDEKHVETSVQLVEMDVVFDEVEFNHQGNLIFEQVNYQNKGKVSFERSSFSNSGMVSFVSSEFSNKGSVVFNFGTFNNLGKVTFESSTYRNEGNVEFTSSEYNNRGIVSFAGSKYFTEGNVSFSNSIFNNKNHVSFISSSYFNEGKVVLGHSKFNNNGDVLFSSCNYQNRNQVFFENNNFKNDGRVSYSYSVYGNSGKTSFASSHYLNGDNILFVNVVWVNDGLSFYNIKFKETGILKFRESLFLSDGGVSFRETILPKEGSTMVQRCYFAETSKVDFRSTNFRHTTFEGGEILWLKGKEKNLEAILKDRLGDGYDDLPAIVKERIEELNKNLIPEFSKVFSDDVKVLWKDLTTESARNLTFRLTNLYGSVFDGVTPSQILLNAPTWAQIDGRNVLFEEKTLREDVCGYPQSTYINQLKNLKNQYTQLKNNLERQGNYHDAGDFHYGEQEIGLEILQKEGKGLKEPGNKFKFWLAIWYRYMSGFGEKPGQAIKVFCQVLLGFTFILAMIGSDYSGITSMKFVDILSTGFLKLFNTAIELITPLSWRYTLGKIGSDWFYYFLLICGQVFLLGMQLPLLILAVRRRFKR